MVCPCKKLKDLQSALTFTIPLPIGTKVFVIAEYSRNDWYSDFKIEEHKIEAYEITERGLSVPLKWIHSRTKYTPVTAYCASKAYFTDRAEAEAELERIQTEYNKKRWSPYKHF